MRRSYKYNHLRVKQHNGGTYEVHHERNGHRWVVTVNDNVSIGADNRWIAFCKDDSTMPRLHMRTKDDAMRRIERA
jgi:hypothetical protein